MLRNPSVVVRLARKTGCRFNRMDSTIAACFESPACRRCNIDTSGCTQLATAIVRTMVGVAAVVGVSGMPNQPPSPIVARTEKTMTRPVATTPARVRTRTPRISAMTTSAAGRIVRVATSVASAKAWLRTTVPARRRSMPGNRASVSARRSRANRVTSAIRAASSVSGSFTVTLTALTAPSPAIRLPANRGSARAVARMRARSSASPIFSGSTRSRTDRSSPSATVCWKLVMESTRTESGVCHARSVSRSVASRARAEVASPSSGTIMKRTLSLFS